MTSEKDEKTSTDEMVKVYREKWGVSEEEAKKQVQKFLSRKPVDRSKVTPSAGNLFPEPVGPLSEKVQDMSQAALSTVYMRKTLQEMNQPPEEIEALKEDMDSVKKDVSGLLQLVNTRMTEMYETLKGKQAEEARQQLIEQLKTEVIKPLQDKIEAVEERIKTEEPPQRVESIKTLKGIVDSAVDDAKTILEEAGYPVPEKRPMVSEPSKEPDTKELVEELRKRGYHIEYDMIPREKALELVKAAREKAQEDVLDDKRIEGVVKVIETGLNRVFDMFAEPLQMWMNSAMASRGAEAGGAKESRREESSDSRES